jgi:hypothetical protein
VVERSFAWMTRWRRLVRDYEQRIDVSTAMILVAMGGNLLRRNVARERRRWRVWRRYMDPDRFVFLDETRGWC